MKRYRYDLLTNYRIQLVEQALQIGLQGGQASRAPQLGEQAFWEIA